MTNRRLPPNVVLTDCEPCFDVRPTVQTFGHRAVRHCCEQPEGELKANIVLPDDRGGGDLWMEGRGSSMRIFGR